MPGEKCSGYGPAVEELQEGRQPGLIDFGKMHQSAKESGNSPPSHLNIPGNTVLAQGGFSDQWGQHLLYFALRYGILVPKC